MNTDATGEDLAEGKSAEEIAAALKELPAEKLAQVKQACFAAGAIEVRIYMDLLFIYKNIILI